MSADINTRTQQSRADEYPNNEPLNHLPPRDVSGHVSRRRRDRFRQVRFRRFRACSNRRLCGRPRFRKNALRFCGYRLRKLPIEPLVVPGERRSRAKGHHFRADAAPLEPAAADRARVRSPRAPTAARNSIAAWSSHALSTTVANTLLTSSSQRRNSARLPIGIVCHARAMLRRLL